MSFAVSLLPSLAQFPRLSALFGPLQLLGYLACSISFAAFFAGSQRRFLLVGATSSMIWVLHYHLLGERLASALSAISLGRNTIASRVHLTSRPIRVALTLLVCALVTTLGLRAGSGPITALPTFAACLSTTATFWLVGRAFRRVYLVSDSCWLLFGLLSGSAAGCVGATVSLGLNLWTIRRQPDARPKCAQSIAHVAAPAS